MLRAAANPRWVDRLYSGLVIYVIAAVAWMLTGLGGPTLTHYVAMVSALPGVPRELHHCRGGGTPYGRGTAAQRVDLADDRTRRCISSA